MTEEDLGQNELRHLGDGVAKAGRPLEPGPGVAPSVWQRITAIMPASMLCEFLSGSQRQPCRYKMAASPAGLLGPDGEEHGDAHVREQQPDAADEQGPARSTPRVI